jgi:multidrug efflux pump subunit AcrB
MSVIPFGFIGAVVGHIIFDMTMSMLSVFGLIALAGVVVNDSLILVEFANRAREYEKSEEDALMAAGTRRFRAIFLTTTTTFVGLLPMLFETSTQAQFVIPMALSLSFGIVAATAITLILVPCLYLVVHDLKDFKQSLMTSNTAS